jgi:uncharacterized membrane protein YfcA
MKYETRAMMAFVFTVVGSGVLGYLAIMGDTNALTALVAIISSVVSFYFGTRMGDK